MDTNQQPAHRYPREMLGNFTRMYSEASRMIRSEHEEFMLLALHERFITAYGDARAMERSGVIQQGVANASYVQFLYQQTVQVEQEMGNFHAMLIHRENDPNGVWPSANPQHNSWLGKVVGAMKQQSSNQ